MHLFILLEQTTTTTQNADADNDEYHHERSKTIVVSLAPVAQQPQISSQAGPTSPPTSPPPYNQNIPNGTSLPLGKVFDILYLVIRYN